MSDLLVSAFTPEVGTGRGLRTYGVARALCAHGPVDLLYAQFGAVEPSPEFREVPGLTLHPIRPGRGPRRLAGYLRARAGGVPGWLARGASPELEAGAARLAGSGGRGRVIADGPIAATATRRLARRRAVIYNAHNLESGFRHLTGSGGGSPGALEAFERQILDDAEEVWMASPAEVEAARELAPEATVRYVPNVVDVARIRPVARRPEERRTLLVADFTYDPNRQALDYLVDEVFPLLWSRLPAARLTVAGRGLDETVGDDPRVEHRGFVSDLAAVYAEAACVAIPLLVGGGSPLKFVEALAYGASVVATPKAAAGLEVTAGREYLEAGDPQSFADAIARILEGEAPELGARARQLAERSYSIEALAARLAP